MMPSDQRTRAEPTFIEKFELWDIACIAIYCQCTVATAQALMLDPFAPKPLTVPPSVSDTVGALYLSTAVIGYFQPDPFTNLLGDK